MKGKLKRNRCKCRACGCLVWCAGAFLLIFCLGLAWEALIALGLLPCPAGLPGDMVHPRIIAELRRAGVVAARENVQFFHCENLYSVSAGSLCTDTRAIAYEGLGTDLQTWKARYEDIDDVQLEWDGVGVVDSENANCTITVTKADGSWFVLCATADPSTGKCEFLETLQRCWKAVDAAPTKVPEAERAPKASEAAPVPAPQAVTPFQVTP